MANSTILRTGCDESVDVTSRWPTCDFDRQRPVKDPTSAATMPGEDDDNDEVSMGPRNARDAALAIATYPVAGTTVSDFLMMAATELATAIDIGSIGIATARPVYAIGTSEMAIRVLGTQLGTVAGPIFDAQAQRRAIFGSKGRDTASKAQSGAIIGSMPAVDWAVVPLIHAQESVGCVQLFGHEGRSVEGWSLGPLGAPLTLIAARIDEYRHFEMLRRARRLKDQS